MSWGIKQINGQSYDLSHLDPFVMTVTPKAVPPVEYNVLVTFGCHTFTRKWTDDDPICLRFEHNLEVRCFCEHRCELSMRLPDIVRSAATGRVHFSQYGNYLIVRDIPGLNGPYVCFFNVTRARSEIFDAIMVVDSAYVKPELPNNLDAVHLSTLVMKTVRGERLPRKRK